ncbi:MAG: UDP-N-acetylglucosamine 1-carboxyvinyltransferase, partial [Clostridia bacterium]|nr:UDP-N-acetylglucosamine 1-carboxyvinyltransferase [Clostridia bacterium]
GGTYAVIPDQIEAGTYMAAAAATGGRVLVKNVIPKHMECITAKLEEMGVHIEEYDDSILVDATAPLKKTNIKTMPYPGFPTDMQPQMAIVMLRAEGTSKIDESIWESRFKYTEELIRMGAEIAVAGKVATVKGGGKLLGAPVRACDLRAGAAMIIAGLTAQGTTAIEDIDHIRRGYERIVEKFSALGADIRIVPD